MTTRGRLLLAGLGTAGLFGAGVVLRAEQGFAFWHRRTLDLAEELAEAQDATTGKTVDFSALGQLPAPVERYLRFALQEGQPLVSSARVSQSGALRLSESQTVWRRFRATQYTTAQRPGFLWDAQVFLPLGVFFRVRDAYVAGHGCAQVDAVDMVTLATVQGKAELTSGALMRYLAEAVWIPTALLPGAGVVWSPIGEHKALATLRDGDTTVSLEFHFGESGEVVGVYTPARYREVGDRYLPTPWRGVHRNYQVIGGMKIPTEGEVMWCLPDEVLPVWRGQIESIEYEFVT